MKKYLTITGAFSILDAWATRILGRIVLFHGYPTKIRTDQGSPVYCLALVNGPGVELRLIQLGKPDTERVYRQL